MLYLDQTLPSIAENLALEDALLQTAERGDGDEEVLRVWEAKQTFIVLGRSSRWEREIDIAAAQQDGVPILRRISGGATVVAAPGCLFYAVLLSLETRPHLRMLDEAHRLVMGKIQRAVSALCPQVSLAGTCDLVLADRKVGGNSLRVQRNWLLYHGTLLNHMDLSLIPKYLAHPPREPDYRGGRSHAEFVQNLDVDPGRLQQRLQTIWDARYSYGELPDDLIRELVASKYSQDAWNLQR